MARMTLIATAVLTAALLTPAACRSWREAMAENARLAKMDVRRLHISGGQIPAELVRSWARRCRQVPFDVEIVGRTDANLLGMVELILDRSDLCCITRRANDFEEADYAKRHPGQRLVGRPVAMRAFAVYAHPDCPIDSLSENQLEGLFMGRLKRWTDVGADCDETVNLYAPSIDTPSGHVLSRFVKDILAEPKWTVCKDTQEVCRRVAQDPNGLGFGQIGFGNGLRSLAIRRHAKSQAYQPETAAILAGKYPLGHAIYCYTAGPPTAGVRELLDWLASPDGQKVIRRTPSWVPIPAASP